MPTKLLRVAIAMTAALLPAGCTPANPTTTHTSKPAAGPTAPALPKGVTQATDVPTQVPNDPAARKSVTITSCAATDGGWAAKGTAANPGDKPKTYTITVFFTTNTATVLHTDTTTVTVDPGKSADWTITGKFAAPDGTLCVLRGAA